MTDLNQLVYDLKIKEGEEKERERIRWEVQKLKEEVKPEHTPIAATFKGGAYGMACRILRDVLGD